MLLPGESQGRGSLVGCRLWGRTESDTTAATQQQQQQQSEEGTHILFVSLAHQWLVVFYNSKQLKQLFPLIRD